MRYVKKYGTTRQITHDNIIGGMRFASWTNKAIDTHSECVIFIASPPQNGLSKQPYYDVVPTLRAF
jgi:hypothetical protein